MDTKLCGKCGNLREIVRGAIPRYFRCGRCAKKEDDAREEREWKRRRLYDPHYSRGYRSTYTDACKAAQKRRRTALRHATPKWLTKEHKEAIKHIYINRPRGFHVDHIEPLQGKNVCGLHVPWNLQYLPARKNIRLSNKSKTDTRKKKSDDG